MCGRSVGFWVSFQWFRARIQFLVGCAVVKGLRVMGYRVRVRVRVKCPRVNFMIIDEHWRTLNGVAGMGMRL